MFHKLKNHIVSCALTQFPSSTALGPVDAAPASWVGERWAAFLLEREGRVAVRTLPGIADTLQRSVNTVNSTNYVIFKKKAAHSLCAGRGLGNLGRA
jgi:hypothetical protein